MLVGIFSWTYKCQKLYKLLNDRVPDEFYAIEWEVKLSQTKQKYKCRILIKL